MRASRRAATLAATALLLAGCSHGSGRQRDGLGAVEAAIPSLERARSAVSTELNAVLSTAAAIDARDAVGARGDRSAMRALVLAHPFDDTRIDAVAEATKTGAASYADAVDVLSAAANNAELPSTQRSALDAVVDAARAEAVTAQALSALIVTEWPRYSRLGELELKWLTRARGGWYRNQKESANAYAVLTAGIRPAVEAARPRLADAAAARQRASETYRRAVSGFRAATSTSPTP